MSTPDATPRILFAEDDPGVREALARALRFEGYDVQTASDGGEALELVGVNPPRPRGARCDDAVRRRP